MADETILVSACFVGFRCRFNGSGAMNYEVITLLKDKPYAPVCPEQLGGLSTPRPKAWITIGCGRDVLDGNSAVLDETGGDVTEAFVKGAEEVLEIARSAGVKLAYLKEGSPSCGVAVIRAGVKGKDSDGPGVTAALLEKHGVKTEGF